MPTHEEKKNVCGFGAHAITLLARLSLLGYAALAVMSFMEIGKILDDGNAFKLSAGDQSFYRLDGDTLYVSLAMCAPSKLDLFDDDAAEGESMPSSGSDGDTNSSATTEPGSEGGDDLTIDNSDVAPSDPTTTPPAVDESTLTDATVDATVGTTEDNSTRYFRNLKSQSTADESAIIASSSSFETCRSVQYLINACSAALAFSAFASVLYLIVDLMARYKCGPINTSAAGGMGLFLVFILLQAAISMAALQEQTQYWVDYFEELVDDAQANHGDNNIDNVESSADTWYWTVTSIAGLVTSALILIDWSVHKCCTRKILIIDEADEIIKAQQQMDEQQKAIEEIAQISPTATSASSSIDEASPRSRSNNNGDITVTSSSSSSSFDKDTTEIDFNIHTRPSITLTSSDRPPWASNNV